MKITLKHQGKAGGCGHEWEVSEAVAEAVRTDISGGALDKDGNPGPNPPVRCPNCGHACRHSELVSTIIRDDGQVLCSDREESIRLHAKINGTGDDAQKRIAEALAVLKAEGVL